MGILIAFWIILTVTYLTATELLNMAKSKGEVLIFRRRHFVNKRSTLRIGDVNDQEALGAEMATMVHSVATDLTQTFSSHDGKVFQWKDVCYDIKNKGEFRRILDHVDGWVQPGTLTALMVRA